MWSNRYWFAKAANSFDENGGAIVCDNGLRYSIFAKHLLQNRGGSACGSAAYFSDHRKPTVIVRYQEIGGRLKLEEINS